MNAKIWIVLYLCSLAVVGNAQQHYTLSHTGFAWQVTQEDDVTYNYILLENISGAHFDMEFALLREPPFPGAWGVEIEYPRSLGYRPDTVGTFPMPTPAQATAPLLVFVAILPNRQCDTGTVWLKLWPSHAPADSVLVPFGLRVVCPTGLEAVEQEAFRVFPNPVRAEFTWQGPRALQRLVLCDVSGREWARWEEPMLGSLVLPRDLPMGCYYLKGSGDEKTYQTTIFYQP